MLEISISNFGENYAWNFDFIFRFEFANCFGKTKFSKTFLSKFLIFSKSTRRAWNLKTTFSCVQKFGSLCVKFSSWLRNSGRLITLSARGCGQISTQPNRNVAYRDWVLGFFDGDRRIQSHDPKEWSSRPRGPWYSLPWIRGNQHSNNKCNPILTNDSVMHFPQGK